MRPSTVTFRVCLAGVLVLATVRAVGYIVYVVSSVGFPLEVHVLEAVMVHHAWRVVAGAPLYPAWETYPHVTNFFTPIYFWIVGGVGRATGADIPDLFIIGRSVTVVATLAATGCLAWYLRARYGTQAASVGALLSLPPAQLYGFSLMTRPDVLADTAGVAGLLLTRVDARKAWVVGAGLLMLALLTKQTAALYLVAAVLGSLADGRYRRAVVVPVVAVVSLALVAVVLTLTSAPLFLASIVQEGRTPLSAAAWMRLAGRLATSDPELLIVSAAGLVWWWWQNERGMCAAMATLLIGSVFTAFKVGADWNYFLPLRAIAALAAGALWAAAQRSFGERAARVTAAMAGALLLLMPSTIEAVAGARQASAQASYMRSASGGPALATYGELVRLVQTPNIRVLSDSAMLALYQKDAAPFTDPWLFRLLVQTGRIHPRQMEHWLESGAYDVLVLSGDLNSRAYEEYDFALPPSLVARARTRYEPVAMAVGFVIYQPR